MQRGTISKMAGTKTAKIHSPGVAIFVLKPQNPYRIARVAGAMAVLDGIERVEVQFGSVEEF